MRERLLSAMILYIAGVAFAHAQTKAAAPPPEEIPASLRGTWTAAQATRDGKPAADVVGQKLILTGSRFEIQSKEGKTLNAGTVHLTAGKKPAEIDFQHTEGAAKGKTWKGVYALVGNSLTICDNAPNMAKSRPSSLEAKAGSGYVLVTFRRTGR
jgi:uncharacterized protein (TIGR03067 family)